MKKILKKLATVVEKQSLILEKIAQQQDPVKDFARATAQMGTKAISQLKITAVINVKVPVQVMGKNLTASWLVSSNELDEKAKKLVSGALEEVKKVAKAPEGYSLSWEPGVNFQRSG